MPETVPQSRVIWQHPNRKAAFGAGTPSAAKQNTSLIEYHKERICQMKSTGIVRCLDELGRIMLPKELRDTMEIPQNTPFAIFVEGEDIILRKYGRSCVFCGGEDDLFDFYDRPICEKCARQIAAGMKGAA